MNILWLSIGLALIWGLWIVLSMAIKKGVNKANRWLLRIGNILQPILFVLVNYALLLLYYLVVTCVGDNYGTVISEVLGPIWVVISWFIVGTLIDEINTETPMKSSDKNYSYFVSVMAVIVYAIIMKYKDGNQEWIHLASLSLAVFIGAYIPISDYFGDEKIKERKVRWKDIIKQFRGNRCTLFFSSVTAVVLCVSAILKTQLEFISVINEQISLGMAIGTIGLVIYVSFVYKPKKSSANK